MTTASYPSSSFPEQRHFLLDQQYYGLTGTNGLNSNFLCDSYNQFPRRTSLCLKSIPTTSTSVCNRNRQNSETENEDDRFKVMLNIKQYDIEEITVEIMNNNCIKIEGYPSPKQTDSSIENSSANINTRRNSFEQSLVLPEDVQVENIECNLSADGIFTLSAPRRGSNDRMGLLDFPMLQI